MNKKSLIISIAFVIAVIFALGAYESIRPQDDSDEVFYFHQFEDFSGEKVTLTSKPKRVAVLFSSLADVWQIAGGETSITVGESIQRGICQEDVLLVDGGAGKTVDIEKLISYEPDFVIYSLDVEAQCKAAEMLKKHKIPTAGMRIESIEDYLKALTICTSLLDTDENMKLYGEDVLSGIQELKMKAALNSYAPEVLFIRSGSSASSAKAKKSSEHFAAKILEELNCINIADSAEVILDGLSIEEILLKNPEYIFISIMGYEEAGKAYMDSLLESEGWSQLDAIKNGRVHYLPKDLFHYKPCARWTDAYRYIYEILYTGDKIDE